MDISVSYQKVKDASEAFDTVKKHITSEYLAKFNVAADVTQDTAKKAMHAKGKGFELDLLFKEDHCEVGIKLSLLLKALKGQILSKVEKELRTHL